MSTPRIGFVLGGVQKGGTTALAQYLGQHPRIALPRGKEAHVFDAPEFDESWSPADIDAHYATHFEQTDSADVMCGDATPIYCFHPTFIRRIAAYNPAMRWVLLLRDPLERAVSQYHMERGRGDEAWPFWAAILFERWRLAGHWHDFSPDSPLRHHSYRARGDYARQLDALYAYFPRQQVLLLRNQALSQAPAATVDAVLAFLGAGPAARPAPAYARVFEGGYPPLRRGSWRHRLLAMLMAEPMARARRQHGLDWR